MRKLFTFLFAALMSVASMWAQEESLLTTLTFGGSDTYGETTSGVVNVTATNVGSYNGTYGWLLDEGGSLSVTAKEGYTITKCVFRQNAKTPITDTEAPFEIHTNYWGGIIEDPEEEMDGVTSIEVYGYANAGGGSTTTVVTITDSDFPASGSSFTKDGVTVSAYAIDGMQGNISGPGSFSTTLGNFTKIEVSAASISVSGEGWSGNYESKTWTGNASSVSFTGSINGYEEGTTLKFTIEDAAPTTHTLRLVADSVMGSVAVTNLLGSDIVDNGDGTYTVPENARVTILATPNEGYEFSGWLEGNVLCDFIDCGTTLNTMDNPLTFTITQDAACKAEFVAVAPSAKYYVVGDMTNWAVNAN